ncbi:MAG: type II toxin-antitoxin system VapC family toxin [Candidatus Sericytochromatia bacterium]
MRYLLDTNICIYVIKQRPIHVLQRFYQEDTAQIGLSSISLFELQYGVSKSSKPEQNATALQAFILPLMILNFDQETAVHAGIIRAQLEQQGQIIGAYDLLIAAHALQHNLVLVSHNVKEFQHVPNLKLENWVTV